MVSLVERFGFPRERYARRYGLVGLVSSLGNGVFYPFSLLYFHQRLDLPLPLLGLCLTIAALVGSAGVSLTGGLVDRFGARNVLVLTAAVRAVLLASYAVVDQLALFLVVAALIALANRTDQVAGQAIINGLAPAETRARWFGLSRMTLNAGIGAGAMVGGLLLDSPSGYPWLVVVNAAAFAVVAVMYLTLPSVSVPVPEKPNSTGVWQDHLFVKVAALNGLLMVVGLSVEVGLPVYLVLYLGEAGVTVSIVFAVNTALVTLLQLPLARYIENRPVMRMFTYGLAGYVISFLAFMLTAQAAGAAMIAVLTTAVCVFTAGEMLISITGMMLVNGMAPAERIGAYVGVSYFFMGTGRLSLRSCSPAALEVAAGCPLVGADRALGGCRGVPAQAARACPTTDQGRSRDRGSRAAIDSSGRNHRMTGMHGLHDNHRMFWRRMAESTGGPVEEIDGALLVTSGILSAPFNQVHLASGGDQSRALAVAARHFDRRGLPWRIVAEDPSTVAEDFAARRHRAQEPLYPIMTLDRTTEERTTPPPSPVVITTTDGLADLRDFVDCAAASFGHHPELIEALIDPRTLAHADFSLYVGRDSDKCVGISVGVRTEETMGVYFGGVVPDHRGRGIVRR